MVKDTTESGFLPVELFANLNFMQPGGFIKPALTGQESEKPASKRAFL